MACDYDRTRRGLLSWTRHSVSALDPRRRNDEPGPVRYDILHAGRSARITCSYRTGGASARAIHSHPRYGSVLVFFRLRLARDFSGSVRGERRMNTWDWEPSVVAGCAALAIGYLAIVRTRSPRRMPYFLVAIALLLLDLVSPIDTLGDQYLFSAHIVQHFLLALIIPPLFLLGTPRWLAAAALERSRLNKLERALGQPPVSWLLGVGTMLAWHVPILFNAALAKDGLHIFQHLSFLVTGTIFWWPILGPLEERRLPVLSVVSYLFSACVCCSLLGE